MDSSQLDGLEWIRSSKCDSGGCVEIAALDATILIRDSTEPSLTLLTVSRVTWQDSSPRCAPVFSTCAERPSGSPVGAENESAYRLVLSY